MSEAATATRTLIQQYYEAFNRQDWETFLDLLDDEVQHDINQGASELGRQAFRHFMERMNRCYRERLTDLVILTEPTGRVAAAEFIVHGEYLESDEGLPPASGQKYKLPGGAFFEVEAGKITRIRNYYNLQDWLQQVSEPTP